jgi:serine/threonine protein kinase
MATEEHLPDPEDWPVETCSNCGTRMDVSGLEPLAEVLCPGCGNPLKVHSRIGNFELLGVAGSGGMGVVYRAFDAELNRQVALKVLKKEQSADPALIAQLDAEATMTASINHPNVVRVFSTGMSGGRFHIAMELVDKGSLEGLIKIQGAVSEAQTLLVGMQAALGLRAAQQHGLIHRDIKPANILFATPALSKIVDFGLAVLQSEEESVRGEIWGTPHYIAPEKIEGKPEDFRSDIYSLGGTLFHAITGRPPFEGENASAIALKHVLSPPVRLQTFAPHVSKRTAYVIDRMLSKDPEQRYQSYNELIEHLQYARNELLDNASTPRKSQHVVMEAPEENKALGWVSAAALILVLLALLFHSQLFPQGSPQSPAPEKSEPRSMAAAQGLIEAGSFKKASQSLQETLTQKGLGPIAEMKALLLLSIAERELGLDSASAATLVKLEQLAEKTDAKKSPLTPVILDFTRTLLPNAANTGSAPEIGEIRRGDLRSLLLFAAGLRAWQSENWTEAAALFRDFRLRAPTQEETWLSCLVALADLHIDDLNSLTLLERQLKASESIEEKEFLAAALFDYPPPLTNRALQAVKSAKVPPPPPTFLAARKQPVLFDAFSKSATGYTPYPGYWRIEDDALRGRLGAQGKTSASIHQEPFHQRANTVFFAPVKARRLRFTGIDTNSGNEPALDEIEVFDTSNANVALASAGTIVRCSDFFSEKTKPELVNDGLFGGETAWIPKNGNGWIELEFPSEKEIHTVVWSRDRSPTSPHHTDRVPIHYEIRAGGNPDQWTLFVAGACPAPLNLKDFVAEWTVQLHDTGSAAVHFSDGQTVLFRACLSTSGWSVDTLPPDTRGEPKPVPVFQGPLTAPSGTWHRLSVEVTGNRACISMDGKLLGEGSHACFEQAKTSFSLDCLSGSASFKNLRIWEAAPKSDSQGSAPAP